MPNMPTKMHGHLRHLSDETGILGADTEDAVLDAIPDWFSECKDEAAGNESLRAEQRRP